MLRGVVASLWVNAAVKGGPCPVIMAAGATNQSVTNVIEAFGRAPHPDESYRLGQRWLPELVSFGAYLPAKGRIQDNAEDYRDFLVLYEPDEAGWSALYRYYQRLPDILDPATSLDLEPAWLSRVKEAGLGEHQEIEAAIESIRERLGRLAGAIAGLSRHQKKDLAAVHESLAQGQPIWSDRRIKLVDTFLARPAAGEIDAVLDLTLRTDAFMLAAHYWEGRFLLAQRRRLLTRHPLALADMLQRLCMLTPCLVSTLHHLPAVLQTDPRTIPADDPRTHLWSGIDLLILDEAGQAPPELVGASLALARRALVVGDIRQLAPIWSHDKLSDYVLADKTGLSEENLKDIVAARRSVANGSALAMARLVSQASDPDDDGVTLRFHYRCPRTVISFCNSLCYDGILNMRKEDPEQDLPPMGWVEVPGTADSPGGSWRNQAEATEMVAWIVESWPKWRQKFAGRQPKQIVALITPYAAQARLLRKLTADAFDVARADRPSIAWPTAEEVKKLVIGTVHSLQGAECEIVCLSLVEGPDKVNSFIDRDTTLINVAVSRAQSAFIVFAHPQRLFHPHANAQGAAPFHRLGRYMREHGQRVYPTSLVIIEAGGKQNKIESILGRDRLVLATGGAIQSIKLGDVDIESGFIPAFTPEKPEVIKRIIDEARKPGIKEIILMPDADRMGEYISWHVERCLKAASVGVPVSRARLGAFTPPAVMARMQERGSINRHLVSAELVRDIIDSIAGARLSRAVRKGVPGPELDKLMQELSGTGGVHGESDGRKVPAEGQSGRPGLGRVTGAVLRDMLDRLRELAGHNPRSRTISVIVDPGARAITGYLCKDGQPYVVCPEERRALQEIWRAPRLRARGMPKTSEWPQPAPLCTTATVMIHAWRRAHIMPWDTMAALQSLYDGTWSGNRKTADEPLDPIDIEWPAGGHPPILPTDRAVPPERMDGQLKPEQKCVYKLAWDFQRIAEWKVLRMRHTVLDCDVISEGQVLDGLTVRIEGLDWLDPIAELADIAYGPLAATRPSCEGIAAVWTMLEDYGVKAQPGSIRAIAYGAGA